MLLAELKELGGVASSQKLQSGDLAFGMLLAELKELGGVASSQKPQSGDSASAAYLTTVAVSQQRPAGGPSQLLSCRSHLHVTYSRLGSLLAGMPKVLQGLQRCQIALWILHELPS